MTHTNGGSGGMSASVASIDALVLRVRLLRRLHRGDNGRGCGGRIGREELLVLRQQSVGAEALHSDRDEE